MFQLYGTMVQGRNDKLGPDEILDFKYRYRQAIAVSLVQSVCTWWAGSECVYLVS